jgi:hypothetical protein
MIACSPKVPRAWGLERGLAIIRAASSQMWTLMHDLTAFGTCAATDMVEAVEGVIIATKFWPYDPIRRMYIPSHLSEVCQF